MQAHPPSPDAPHPLSWPERLARWRRFAVVTVLGFASGLPLALSGQALQAWLAMDGLDVATIGFLSDEVHGIAISADAFRFTDGIKLCYNAFYCDTFEVEYLATRKNGW